LRIANTETDNLLGNLRGEIAEVVTAWILMRQFMVSGTRLSSGDLGKDLSNPDLTFMCSRINLRTILSQDCRS